MISKRQYALRLIFSMLVALATSLSAQQWVEIAPLNTPRHSAAVAVYDQKIYVFGGTTTNGVLLKSVEVYDPATGIWATNALPLDIARSDAQATFSNGEIFVSGGVDSSGEELKEVEVYDPVGNSWREIEEMRRKRRGHIAEVINGFLCVMGGIRENSQYVEEYEWYLPSADDWEEGPQDFFALRVNPFATVQNNQVYLFGGILNVPFADSYVCSIDGSWIFSCQTGPALQSPRANGATAVVDDKMYMLGGITSSGTATDRVEVYDINQDMLTDGPTLSSPRIGAAAAVLNDTIYMIGGYQADPNQPSTMVERYDPLTAIGPPAEHVAQSFVQIKGYPNPFNGEIRLELDMVRNAEVELAIYNIRGQKVRDLFMGRLPAGRRTFQWNARDNRDRPLASGLYLAVASSPSFKKSFKIVYTR